MAMPSFPYHMSDYVQNPAEVPSDLLHLQDLDYWTFADESVTTRSPLKPQRDLHHGHVPILPKAEPDYLPEYLENLPHGWYSNSQEAPFVPMAANFQSTPTDQLQLQISEPPTPAAECQVTSTNLSPLPPNSPYSPHSDVSYEGGEGFESGLMDGSDVGLNLAELESHGNLKGLTEEQLVSLTARDLNRLCRDMPEDVIKQLKKRRRTLKNRGYAYNSRIRRVTQKNGLEVERDDLKKQLLQLTERCKLLEQEAQQWKQRAQALEAGNV